MLVVKQKQKNTMATQNKLTHKGTKKATFSKIKDAEFYFSRPVNPKAKKGSTFLNVSGWNPKTNEWDQVQLSARQITELKKVITA